jgi:hypothetical protein
LWIIVACCWIGTAWNAVCIIEIDLTVTVVVYLIGADLISRIGWGT